MTTNTDFLYGNTNGNTDSDGGDGPTTWEPFDLGPYLRGEIKRPRLAPRGRPTLDLPRA